MIILMDRILHLDSKLKGFNRKLNLFNEKIIFYYWEDR